MKAHSYTAVPVIDEYGKYVGTVSEGDFLWYIVEKQTQGMKSQEKYFVRDLIRTDFNPSVKISVDMKELYERALNPSKNRSRSFASPSAFVVVQTHSAQARDMLVVAQDQHRQALDAIERREGARAEAILREHSRITRRNLLAAVQASQVQGLPGVQLIRERA